MSEDLSQVGREIERLLDGRSQDWLSAQSGVKQPTISRIMRGRYKDVSKQVRSLGAIAGALRVDPAWLLQLAGVPLPKGIADLDPSAAYIARRLTELPPSVREDAIEVLGAQLDAIYKLVESQGERRSREQEGETLEELLAEFSDLPPEARKVIEQLAELWGERPDLQAELRRIARLSLRTSQESERQ